MLIRARCCSGTAMIKMEILNIYRHLWRSVLCVLYSLKYNEWFLRQIVYVADCHVVVSKQETRTYCPPTHFLSFPKHLIHHSHNKHQTAGSLAIYDSLWVICCNSAVTLMQHIKLGTTKKKVIGKVYWLFYIGWMRRISLKHSHTVFSFCL